MQECFKRNDIEDVKKRNVNELIKEATIIRLEKNLSQRKLAAMAGMAQAPLAKIETGKRAVGLLTFLKILNALGKTLKIVDIKDKGTTSK